MNFGNGQSFEERIFLWSREQARLQLKCNFELIRKIKSVDTADFIEVIDSLPIGTQEIVVDALVKRTFPEGRVQAGEDLTQQEQEVLQEFDEKRMLILTQGKYTPPTILSNLVRSKLKKGIQLTGQERKICDESGKLIDPVNKVSLKKLVKIKMQEHFKVKPKSVGGGELGFYFYVNDFTVFTGVDLGGTNFQMAYHHEIYYKNCRLNGILSI